jgi:hypothetical protein
MTKSRAGERRVAKRRLCLDERGSRRPLQEEHAVVRWRLRASEEDTVSRRVMSASQQEAKTS